ncbi:MAG TPA: hypothetical protein VKW76_15535 [Candidatus Binatia bacterium]|nr:hypothetical protein [Candidatus Binatia bacterium]
MSSEQARVVALLDELQAAERAGALALEQWIRSCHEPALRGGLRVVAARDAAHAALAEERLRTLGAGPSAQVSRGLAALCSLLGASDVSDRSKLTVLLARFPGEVYDPFAELVRSIEDDGETRALLETIGDDERASLRWLREAGETLPRVDDGGGSAERELVVPLLDALRAAEAAADEVLAAWIAVCASPGLRGGLRTIAAREGVHARLLAERVRELGAVPGRALSEPLRRAALTCFGASGVSDTEKISRVLGRYPDDTAASSALDALARELSEDLETRELLRLIAAGEAATVGWLRAYHAATAGPGKSAAAAR